MTRTQTALLFCSTVLVPGLANACPVCGGGFTKNRFAFIATTAFMTVLPLLSVGGLVWWIRGRALEMRESDARALQTHELSRPELPMRERSVSLDA